MAERRNHRIVKRFAMTVAVVILLLSAYVSSYVGMFWLLGRGTIGFATVTRLQTTVFEPIRSYGQHDWPGSEFIGDVCSWVHLRGSGNPISWREWRNRPE